MAIVLNGSGTVTGLSAGGISNANAISSAALPAGSILQVVEGSSTTQVEVTATSLTDSGLSATITPASASSKILVLVNQIYTIYRHDDDNNGGIVLLRGSTIIGSYMKNSSDKYWGEGMDAQGSGADRIENRLRWNFSYLDSPSTTSATTYKTQGAVYGGTDDEKITFQRDGGAGGTDGGSYMQLIEVAA